MLGNAFKITLAGNLHYICCDRTHEIPYIPYVRQNFVRRHEILETIEKKKFEVNTHWLDASEFFTPEAERTSVCARDR